MKRAYGLMVVLVIVASICAAQGKPSRTPAEQWQQELNKYPGLIEEFGRVLEKVQQVQLPPARNQSRLLPLLPAKTISYMAFSNYGDAVHQAMMIFQQQLRESAVLREWWQQAEPAASGRKLMDTLDKAYKLSQYLGDEIVVSAKIDRQEPGVLLLAEVRKPGLKDYLRQMVNELSGKSKPGLRILDLQELATVEAPRTTQELIILVRPDFVVASFDLGTLRSFSASLDRTTQEFASTPFAQRLAHSYEGGATLVAGADLQNILKHAPPEAAQNSSFQQSGFADLKYLVWEHKTVDGQSVSQTELSFLRPRRGMASWLAPAQPLGSLEFVSPRAILVSSLVLNNPPQIFDDIRRLAVAANPNAFATVTQMERQLNLSLKDDLLRMLGGEITLEIDRVTPPELVWKAILRANDPVRLQQTLHHLLTVWHMAVEESHLDGMPYSVIRIPSPRMTMEIAFSFVDGYLVIASKPEMLAQAVQLHRNGKSLGKSTKFLAALPPGHDVTMSAMLYQDPIAMTALRLQALMPALAGSLAQAAGEGPPAVVCAYGEESTIRSASTSAAVDAGAILVVAAIAIPNLLRSRIAANEASAVGTLRAVNSAQLVYSSTYPDRGFANELATLGPDPRNPTIHSAEHAGLLSAELANPSCTAAAWCTKAGFRFSMTADCQQGQCRDFIVMGTPLTTSTGARSFCSTSDAVIRYKVGAPIGSLITAAECFAWTPLR